MAALNTIDSGFQAITYKKFADVKSSQHNNPHTQIPEDDNTFYTKQFLSLFVALDLQYGNAIHSKEISTNQNYS